MLQKTEGFPVLVQQVARLIHTFNQQQLHQLFELAPELETALLQRVDISDEQAELALYFNRQLEAFAESPLMQDSDPFVGNLTVGEFFALPESEQDRIWNEAHLAEERKLKGYEHPIQPNALPA